MQRALLAALLLVLSAWVLAPAQGGHPESLGPSGDTWVLPQSGDNCGGVLEFHHDGSFENGYCWTFTQEPYCGAFGEAFDLGPVFVECASYWLTQTGSYQGQRTDIYIWAGGVSALPGEVLYLATNHIFDPPPALWPNISQHDVEVMSFVTQGEFTVGLWADTGAGSCTWFIASDEDGPGGHPWTFALPGAGYPTGWQHPGEVWPGCRSLGIGLYWGPFSPTESPSWGAIKRLFR
jgi:hypothetical protein